MAQEQSDERLQRRVRTLCHELLENLFAFPVDNPGLARWGKRGGVTSQEHASSQLADEASADPKLFSNDDG